MKHPRHRAETIRIPLGFLILSLWKRPSSWADFCPGSYDNRRPSSSYFITDNSTEPARSHLTALVIFSRMFACPYRRTKRRKEKEKKKRWGAAVARRRVRCSPVFLTVTMAFLCVAGKPAGRASGGHRLSGTVKGLLCDLRAFPTAQLTPFCPKPRGLRLFLK